MRSAAEVVEAEPGGEFGVLDGGPVVAGHEGAVAEGSAFGGGEDVAVAAGELGEVVGEHAGEEAGDGDGAVVSGVGGAFDDGAVDFAEAGDDVEEVAVFLSERVGQPAGPSVRIEHDAVHGVCPPACRYAHVLEWMFAQVAGRALSVLAGRVPVIKFVS